MTVWLFGSLPFSTRTRSTFGGKEMPTSLKRLAAVLADGSDPT